ncbi:Tetratricopeptide repeat domain protein [Planktothrix serta PCC 8927]|uniref:non-specific serine/threonine protein kinase n=1 Tax=Planktothrix serta PCC 8927 TaxID=671068 RepID=A0A7Z9BL33_9CYAN|nr:serine/threonine-protein kinase [Planktothrix serta]VXD14917.1 Tetratricopeptide repeat domain protein [Planktothrix serta PCC 8927]
MNYCINPECKSRENPHSLQFCQSCKTPLLLQGRYRLLKPLRALDPRYSTDIFEIDDQGNSKVMKVLKYDDPELLDLFFREASILKDLDHPGIPRVERGGFFKIKPTGSSRRIYCLVMEKIAGENLETWLTNHARISEDLALKWLRQICEILDILHQKRFFHRDIKPANIICKPDNSLALIDFGTAREMTVTHLAKVNLSNVTTVISGGYSPPEQMNGQAVLQSDFFALGRTFVHLLTGISPLELPKDSKTGKLIWRNQAPKISSAFANYIDGLMEPESYNRPHNAREILKDLTPSNLRRKQIERFTNQVIQSPKFKVLFAVSITLSITGSIIFHLAKPAIANYYYQKGAELLEKGNHAQAKPYFDKALIFNKNADKIYNNLGLICRENNDFECTHKNYQKALTINPENYVSRYNLGGVYDDLGNFQQAEIQYKLAMQSDQSVGVYAQSDLARLQILKGDPVTGIELSLEGLKKTDKTSVQAALHKNLGWAYWMKTEYNSAEFHLQQAIKLNEKRGDSHCLLAQVLEAKNQKMESLQEWKACLKADSQNKIEVKIWQTIAIQRLREARQIL